MLCGSRAGVFATGKAEGHKARESGAPGRLCTGQGRGQRGRRVSEGRGVRVPKYSLLLPPQPLGCSVFQAAREEQGRTERSVWRSASRDKAGTVGWGVPEGRGVRVPKYSPLLPPQPLG